MSKTPNHMTFRVRSTKTLRLIEELLEKIKNKTTVLNDALDIGIPILYARIFGKGRDTADTTYDAPNAVRELKELRLDVDDLFVLMDILEPMIAGLYNTMFAQVNGEKINPQELITGALCELPPELADLKSELIARHAKRKGRK